MSRQTSEVIAEMNLALLALRGVVGLTFAAHGSQKLFGIFGGRGLGGTAAGFDQIGLRPGRIHAAVAGSAELLGGLLLALGLVTTIDAAALIAVMTAAVLSVHLRNGFFVANNGFEFNLALVAVAFALAGIGPGAWSLDHLLNVAMHGTDWALGALGAGLVGGISAVIIGRNYPDPASRRHHQPTAA